MFFLFNYTAKIHNSFQLKKYFSEKIRKILIEINKQIETQRHKMVNYFMDCSNNTPIGMLPLIINHNNKAIEDEINAIFDSSSNRIKKSVYVPQGYVKSHSGEFVNLYTEHLTVKNFETLNIPVDKILTGAQHNTFGGRFSDESQLSPEDISTYAHDAGLIYVPSIGATVEDALTQLMSNDQAKYFYYDTSRRAIEFGGELPAGDKRGIWNYSDFISSRVYSSLSLGLLAGTVQGRGDLPDLSQSLSVQDIGKIAILNSHIDTSCGWSMALLQGRVENENPDMYKCDHNIAVGDGNTIKNSTYSLINGGFSNLIENASTYNVDRTDAIMDYDSLPTYIIASINSQVKNSTGCGIIGGYNNTIVNTDTWTFSVSG